MYVRLVAALATLLGAACTRAPATAERERVITIVALAELRGTTEPCGCTSDPLGDVARVVTLIHDAERQGAVLLVDAGGLVPAETAQGEERAQAAFKAAFLEETWEKQAATVALGEEDLARAGGITTGRLAANVAGVGAVPSVVRALGDVGIGVFAVFDPALAPPGFSVGDPEEAARQAMEDLRRRGAKLVVALVHGRRALARRLLRALPGLSLAVVGHDVGAGSPPEQIGEGILVQPAAEGQKLAWVEIHLAADGRLSTRLTADETARGAQAERIATRLGLLESELARLTRDPAADPAYVAARAQERDMLREQQRRLEAPPPLPQPPYAAARLVPVSRHVPRDARTAQAMRRLDARIGEANRQASETITITSPPRGAPRYLGSRACSDCHERDHDDDWAMWKGTAHARAWAELVRVSKQWSYDCIRCHVTGYGERGGSAMGHVDGLTDVGCEACHGPGSHHAARPRRVKTPNGIPDERVCKTCHTPEHSDTFEFTAYLRDVLGPGHGETRRSQLGEGATGRGLRQAALEQAKRAP